MAGKANISRWKVGLRTRKSADVVIPMQPSSDYTLLFPNNINWDDFVSRKADVPFSETVVDYLNALSVSLLKDSESRLYPDVVTFAFFCRKASLLRLKEELICKDDIRLGRGILFHIAPGNVPVNFAYTLVAGLLAGNRNVVRVSGKEFPQVDIIIRHIHKLAEDISFQDVSERIALVRYGHTSDASAYFSSIADVRVIWGGDQTISTIRKNELPPRSFDVCFADRYSVALINPDSVIQAGDDEIKRLSEGFYNDTYLFDQNACSAPHLIFWRKTNTLSKAKMRFWMAVHQLVKKKYDLQAVLAVDKLMAFCRQAIKTDINIESMPDNYVMRVQLHDLPANIDSFRCAGGYFSEYDVDTLDEIAPIVTNKYQTMAYYGFNIEDLKAFVLDNHLDGLDRIVPIGDTTAFSLVWDGNNLIDIFSRIIFLK